MNKEVVLPADDLYIPAVELRAGDITAMYEKGRLRYVSAGNTEIVRMIYPALRDQNWSTIASVKNEEKISRQQQSFSISYSAVYESGDIHYKAFYKIEGRADSTIVFSMRGEALSSFQKRRIGLCLLHPVETCSGREVEVVQPDGSSYNSSFPPFVSPLQPFLHVQGMKWITENNTLAEIVFEGEVFETEDQRNWSDNSYKTYSTPLSLPAPAMVHAGDIVEQKITVRADITNTVFKKSSSQQKEIKIPFPRIGYARGEGQSVLTADQIALLIKIPFDHYRVQLNLSGNWQKVFENAVLEAKQLQAGLELIVNFELLTEEELHLLVGVITPSKALIFSVLVLAANQETAPRDFYVRAYKLLKAALGDTAIGYGTNNDFADLNRNRPAEIDYDFVNFYLQPQVHTVDNRSIMDNLDSHETLIRSANKFSAGKPVHVSPVVFAARNIADRRLGTYFAAWWTLLALRNLSGAPVISFYELTGEKGILNETKNTAIYSVLKTIKEFSPTYIFQNTGEKVVLENADGDRLVFSSKLPHPQAVK